MVKSKTYYIKIDFKTEIDSDKLQKYIANLFSWNSQFIRIHITCNPENLTYPGEAEK